MQEAATTGRRVRRTHRDHEIEFEVIPRAGTPIRLHRTCNMIWLEECEPSAASAEPAAATP